MPTFKLYIKIRYW